MGKWVLRGPTRNRVTASAVDGSSSSMMLTSSPWSARLARLCDRAYRLPMSAWPGAHAGFGVDGAAPDLTPAGDGRMVPRTTDRSVTRRRTDRDDLEMALCRRRPRLGVRDLTPALAPPSGHLRPTGRVGRSDLFARPSPIDAGGPAQLGGAGCPRRNASGGRVDRTGHSLVGRPTALARVVGNPHGCSDGCRSSTVHRLAALGTRSQRRDRGDEPCIGEERSR